MDRSVRFSTIWFAVALSPALLQGGDCGGGTIPTGDTSLTLLELDVGGQNQVLSFDTNDRAYDVWIPDTVGAATLRAAPTDPAAEVTWSLGQMSGSLGVGGGQAFLGISPGPSTLFVFVRPTGGAVGNYMIDINPRCGNQGECDDGNPCSEDAACDVTTGLCPPPTPTPDRTVCNLTTGEDAFCNGAGECRAIGSQEWGIPQLLEANRHQASFPTVAINSAGDAVAVWQQEISETWPYIHDIWASHYTTSAGWDEPELLESVPGDVELPQVAMDAAGNAIAIWETVGTTPKDIWTNRYTPAGGWAGAELLETEDGSATLGSDDSAAGLRNTIAMAPDGKAIVVWSQWDNGFPVGGYDAMARRYTPGVGWAAPEVLHTVPSSSTAGVQVGWDGNGNAIALWQLRGIRSKRYTPGGGWSSMSLVSDFDVGDSPRLAVDAAGNAVAVWTQTDCSSCEPAVTGGIHANRYAVGVGWGSPQLLYTESSLPIVGFDVVANSAGDAAVVWRESRFVAAVPSYVEAKLWAIRYSQGAWQAPEAILAGPGGEPVNGTLVGDPIPAADVAGNFIVLWGAPVPDQFEPGSEGIMSLRFVDGVGWGAPTSIESNGAHGAAVLPRVAFAANGGAMAVWADGDVIWHDIWAVRLHP